MKAKLTYLGAGIGLIAGLILYLISDYLFFLILGPLAGFLSYDYRNYQKLRRELEEQAQREAREQKEKEQKRLERQMKKTQKKNREDKVFLYENIYTVAGYCLAQTQELSVYIKNAEEVIAHFKVSSEVRAIAVEAFNRALDQSFDFNSFVDSYLTNIGKNRDYIKYVLTYAYLIASVDGEMDYEVKDRLVSIANALGSSKAALKRLFESKGAEARFAKEFDDENNQSGSDYSDKHNGNSDSSSSEDSSKSSHNNSDSNSRKGYSSSGTTGSNDKTAQALGILGLDSNATFDDVKRAHKKMMFQYHPDRLAAQNLSPDMVEIYTDKAKSVQAAYDYLKKIYSDYI